MIHDDIKDCFAEAVRSVASNISAYVLNPDKDLTRAKKSRLTSCSLLWSPAVLPAQNLNCSIFSTWMRNHRLLPPLTSSGQNSDPRLWKLFSGTLTALCRTPKIHLATDTFLLMALPLPSLASLPLHRKNILCQKGIPQKGFTVCI